MRITNFAKMDFYEAAKYALTECEAIRRYFAEDGITLENLESRDSEEIYDIATSGIGIVVDRNGILATGEEAFRILSAKERSSIGERWFIGEHGRYIVPASKKAAITLSNLMEGLSFAEEIDSLDQDQEDIYT